MKQMHARAWIALTALALVAAVPARAAPGGAILPGDKPVRIIVPFTAGSATDVMARLVGPRMGEIWGRQVVVDNRPSAGGIVACTIVAEAAPDGHTVLITGSNFAGSAALYSKLPFDPVKDFSGISQFASTPLVLVVSFGLKVKSVKELIALAKAKPGQLNFASTGLGSGPHYGAALFNLRVGISAVHVPYRGSPETLTDLVAGRVQYLLSPVLAASPLVKGGKIQALIVTTPYRAGALPDVPTPAEAGIPQFEYQGWYGMLVPSRMPRALVNRFGKDAAQVIAQPEVKERIASLGGLAKSSSPEEFDKLVHEEITTRRAVWKAAGVKVE
ncbi:MAG: tripartite tricarboxylate transporter substrate binding protein [Burkholderiales bacterium]|nr:tripartite tricarboxylate transporter substrate binding protein [Burkholderiales bacterium]